MRPALLLLATAASYVSAAKVGCPQHLFEELVARTSCGDNKSISKCLISNVNLGRLNEIEQCYIAGGCPKADARVGAVWLANEYRAEVRGKDERVELRRRADSTDSKSDSAAETSETATETSETTTEKKTTAETTAKTTSAAKTTESTAAASLTAAASSAAATTTSTGSTAASTAAATTSTTTGSTSSTTTSSTSSTTSGTQVITTGTLLCSTTSTIQTSACSASGGKTISCSAVLVATASCVPGLLCMVNSDGDNTCMKVDNTVGVGGIVIGIVFGGAIVATMLGLIIMKCTASNAAKNREREQEALLSGYKAKRRTADVEAYAPRTSEANLPLISEPGRGYGGGRFTDHGRWAPQLHQGLGTLA